MKKPRRVTTPKIQQNIGHCIANRRHFGVITLLLDEKFTPATTRSIAEKLGLTPAIVNNLLAQLQDWELVTSTIPPGLRKGRPEYEYSVPAEYRPHLVRIINSVQMLVNMKRTVDLPTARASGSEVPREEAAEVQA